MILKSQSHYGFDVLKCVIFPPTMNQKSIQTTWQLQEHKTYTVFDDPACATVDMPCLCLCLGFAVHNTYTRPRRFTVRQNSHIFFTEDRTFMITEKQN